MGVRVTLQELSGVLGRTEVRRRRLPATTHSPVCSPVGLRQAPAEVRRL